jgi:hypothetical protein
VWSYPSFRGLGAGRVETWEHTAAKAILYPNPLLSYDWTHGKIRRVQRIQIQNPSRFVIFCDTCGVRPSEGTVVAIQ